MRDTNGGVAPRARVAYLAQVRSGLRLTEADATDVIEELAAHVADATEALRAEGLTDEQAEREALARLGSPDALATEIRRAHQTTRRALAAAGAGVVAGAKGGFLGLAVAYASVIIGWAALFTILAVIRPLVGQTNLQISSSLGTLLMTIVWAGGAYLAARAATGQFAVRSHRSVQDVRIPMALVATAVVTALVLTQRLALDAWNVAALMLVPVAAAAGALRATEQEGRRRSGLRLLLVAAFVVAGVVVIPLVGLYGAPSGGTDRGLVESFTAEEYRRVHAPRYASMGEIREETWTSPPIDVSYAVADSEATLEVHRVRSLTGWSDVRLEAWIRDPATDSVPPDVAAPIVAAALDGVAPHRATIDVGRFRDVGSYFLVVAGNSPDGARVILVGPSPHEAAFHGTVLEWLQAPSARP